eukprot:TRINITY_DN81680_c0_g1_i1.p1 TRINITY_DN81680_c0_g1~~TRINITY_DN81680_c0_g1_i1.p1  ORF type:complete len:360 (+),score=96.08 TRINITY_DN81680_c0_g1_i1:74-1153(+)
MVEAARLDALRSLRRLLDQDLEAAKEETVSSLFDTSRSLDSVDEPEKEIPRSNQCSSQVHGHGEKGSEMKALLAQLSEQSSEETKEVISTVQAALALADLHRRRPPSEEEARGKALGGAGSESEQLADSLQARLMSTRKALKDREWALAEARHRQQQMEDDRLRQDCRIRALETALDRASCKSEADRSADIEAAKQMEELRNKLSASEASRQKAEAALQDSEQRAEEALSREQDLQRELAESVRELEELRSRLRFADETASAEPAAQPKVDISTLKIQGMPDGGLHEAYIEGVGMLMSTPRPHHLTAEEPPAAPRGTPPKPEGKRMSAAEQPSKRPAPPMPMNLRSLGKLLSGGGVLGK